MNYEDFNHDEFLANPEPEPNWAFSGEDPPVYIPPDTTPPNELIGSMGVLSQNQRSWQTREPSIDVLDEINDWIKPYADAIVIAICDTGENPHNILPKPLAMESFVPGQSAFDGNSHGTHVAGSAAGSDRRYTRLVGFQHIVAKVLSNQGSGSSTGIERGIRWATQWKGPGGEQCRVINLSLGGSGRHAGTINACNDAASLGCVPLAAAGNSGHRGMGFPAKDPSVPGIANRREDGSIAASSSRGQVLIADAGTQILSASHRGKDRLAFMSGTSMATPCLANVMGGVHALRLASGLPNWRSTEPVFDLSKKYGVDMGRPGYDTDSGYGYPDIEKLLTDMAHFGPKIFTRD
ncbi:MAG: S8 family serine peptidase [Planctomycetota bacterium]